MEQDVVIVRIYISEADHGRRKNLMEEILGLLRHRHGITGVTVFRAIAGVGESGEIHTADLLRLTVDLPLVIEFFDAPQAVAEIMPPLRSLAKGHSIVSWSAKMLRDPATGPA